MDAMVVDLEVFTLSSVLQLAEADQVTGALRFEPEGSIVLRQGRVVAAVYAALTGMDAALTLLMLASKRAVFEAFDVEASPPLTDMMALVIDGSRLNDDWGTLAPQVLALRPGTQLDSPSGPLARVLEALDGRRIVHEAVDLVGVQIIAVIDDLLDLRQAGTLVEVASPRPQRMRLKTATPAPARPRSSEIPPTDLDFFQLIDASRLALRQKAYAEALQLLERAATIRPDDRTVFQNIRRIRQMLAKQT